MLVCALALAACGNGAETTTPPPAPPAAGETTAGEAQAPVEEPDLLPGGTLRVAVPEPGVWLDLELTRCCLTRTLLAYNGRPTEEGGAELRPDLASELPAVSEDGLTWTFRLKPGLRYAPPFDDVEITATDVIRGIEHSLENLDEDYFATLFLVIDGAQAFADGEADSISGLEAPDALTLSVHLVNPIGDLGHRFVFAQSAPVPPGAEQVDPGFLPESGPYMDRSTSEDVITLVRNPSWSAGSDPLRAAYPDRIEIELGGDPETLASRVDAGDIDMALDLGTVAPEDQIRRYENDPDLQKRVFVTPSDVVRYLTLNVAMPPFDDVHVRRAVNFALDKAALRELAGANHAGQVATHLAPDSLLGNLLLDYDPYPSEGHTGDIAAAKSEMAKSRYDRDSDGVCDEPVCKELPSLARSDTFGSEYVAVVMRSLEPLGITLDPVIVEDCCSGEPESFYGTLFDPTSHVALALGTGFGKDFAAASSFYEDQFASRGHATVSHVGASPEQLREWGYPVSEVDSVDDEIDACLALVGGAQVDCWAQLDQQLMERVVPAVPWLFEATVRVVSERVASYTIDQWTTIPALDRIALEPE
jgi:peptide/nickel transport system substrate-binding protein